MSSIKIQVIFPLIGIKMNDKYYQIVKHYEECFNKYGVCAKGVDWPNESDLMKRYSVMIEIIEKFKNKRKLTLLDLGCGFGLFYKYLNEKNYLKFINYKGIDISDKMINEARKLFPNVNFQKKDILKEKLPENYVDIVVMNGVLTEKLSLTEKEMKNYAKKLIKEAFNISKIGVAFNVMTKHVDWERNDLFYWGFDDLAEFLCKECSRNFVFRMDYGLYEFTTYIYKNCNY